MAAKKANALEPNRIFFSYGTPKSVKVEHP